MLSLGLGETTGDDFGIGVREGAGAGSGGGVPIGTGEAGADGEAGSGPLTGVGEGEAFETISSRRFKICSRFQSGTR